MYAASARRRLRSALPGLRSAARSSRVTAPTTSPRWSCDGRVLDGDRRVLVWGIRRFGEVVPSPFGLVGEQVGQSLVSRASFFVRRPDDPETSRAFQRDVLGWPYVEDPDPEPGWLIFNTGAKRARRPSDLRRVRRRHLLIPAAPLNPLMCDDVEATVVDLSATGAAFRGSVESLGFGLAIWLVVPGAGEMLLYEPRHPTAHDLS
jgi:hypothetical protein